MTQTTATNRKTTAYHGVPWEEAYGYAQAVQIGSSIFVSGQLSHNANGDLVGAAELDTNGRPKNFDEMAVQMEQTYANARKILAQFGSNLDDVVEETLYVLDVDAAFAVAGEVRRKAYGTDKPQCASNLIGVSRLAFPAQLIEISFRAEKARP